ncbi:unnamed protein product [Citrullus colocynthis]|uniref:BHLH domain-containing protein n=1 Tax=Citrullus colocynthis TaxID=252529 RepID=A0ABP0Y9P9_9ROSI
MIFGAIFFHDWRGPRTAKYLPTLAKRNGTKTSQQLKKKRSFVETDVGWLQNLILICLEQRSQRYQGSDQRFNPMENDDLKSEDQMEIMMMMQQMEKIPEFYNDFSPPSSDFSSSSTDHPHCHLDSSSSPPLFINNPPYNNFPQSTVSFPATTSRWRNSGGETESLQKQRSVAAMREMIFRIAVMQPIHIDPEAVKPPKRRNVKISTDPQSVAARHRRERISERIRILQRLVPGGTKMDTASMLDEAIHYVKFLKTQVQSLERAAAAGGNRPITGAAASVGFPLEMSTGSYIPNHSQP